MERLARQNSRREDKEHAETEMQKLEPARQRVEAQKVAHDQAREGAGQAKRAGLEQTVLDVRRRAWMDRGEVRRLGGGEAAPQGSGEKHLRRGEEETTMSESAPEQGNGDANHLEGVPERVSGAVLEEEEKGGRRMERLAMDEAAERVATEGEGE